MKVRGIARQLAIAIGLALLIMAIVGGFSIWCMFGVREEMGGLTSKHLPQVEASRALERAASQAMFAIRGYLLHDNEADLLAARSHFDEVDERLEQLSSLVASNPDLTALANLLPTATQATKAYQRLREDTVACRSRQATARAQLDKAAATYMEHCVDYLADQYAILADEMKTGTAGDASHQRIRRIELATDIQAKGYGVLVLTTKAMAAHETTSMQKALDLFPQISADLAELGRIAVRQASQEHLAQIRQAAADFQTQIESLRKEETEVAYHEADRTEAARRVLDVAQGAADAGSASMTNMAANVASSISFTVWAVLGGTAVAVVLGIAAGLIMVRRISQPLLEGSQVLASAASELSATVSQIAASAGETAVAVRQTSTTMDEVRQTAQLAGENARNISSNAQQAAQTAQRGSVATGKSVEGLNRIGEQMQAITGSVMSMSEKSLGIGDIITTVNDLAEQSNLLAVNASIEAARAGEQGKGFAVVAQEIRSLAEQSKAATKQVRTILNDVQKATGTAVLATEQGSRAVHEGQDLVGQAAEVIASLAAAVSESSQAATQIAASSQQQLAGMEQTSQAMEHINEASMQNQASTTQLANSAKGLQDLGIRLQQLVRG